MWPTADPNSVYISDPTTGLPVRGVSLGEAPNTPPPAFLRDPWVDQGFDIWKEGNELDPIIPNVGIYLTDPSRPDGLNYEYFANEVVPHFEVVGFTSWRSVLQDEKRRRAHDERVMQGLTGGALAEPNMAHPEYDSQLLQALGNTFHFSFNPTLDHEGQPQGISSQVLHKAHQQVVDKFSPKEVPDIENPDLEAVATDIAYTNMLGWHMVGQSAMQLQELAERENDGRLSRNVLLVVPYEQRDFARKLGTWGNIPEIEMVPADERVANEFDNVFYGLAMQNGKLNIHEYTDGFKQ